MVLSETESSFNCSTVTGTANQPHFIFLSMVTSFGIVSIVFLSVPFLYTALTVFTSIVFTSVPFLNTAPNQLPRCRILFTTLINFDRIVPRCTAYKIFIYLLTVEVVLLNFFRKSKSAGYSF